MTCPEADARASPVATPLPWRHRCDAQASIRERASHARFTPRFSPRGDAVLPRLGFATCGLRWPLGSGIQLGPVCGIDRIIEVDGTNGTKRTIGADGTSGTNRSNEISRVDRAGVLKWARSYSANPMAGRERPEVEAGSAPAGGAYFEQEIPAPGLVPLIATCILSNASSLVRSSVPRP
jgi:hypothetical protein